MPGLKQLTQFSEDMRAVGDEEKIRALRGEKVIPVALPQGISEADDSDDFIIGLPETKDGAENAPADSLDAAIADDSPIDLDNLDSLLGGETAADDDALADFLNDDALSAPADDLESVDALEESPASEPETPPLEDLDLDSLLQPTSDSAPETVGTPEASAATPDISDLGSDTASVGGDDFSLDDLDLSDIVSEPTSSPDSPLPEDASSSLSDMPDLSADLGSDLDTLLDSSQDSSSEIPQDISGDATLDANSEADLNSALSNLGDLTDMGSMDSVDSFSEDFPLGEPAASGSAGADDALDLSSLDIDSLLGDDASPVAGEGATESEIPSTSGAEELPEEGISLGEEGADGSIQMEDISGDDLASSLSSEDDLDLGGVDSFDLDAPLDSASGSASSDLGNLGSFDIDSLVSGDDSGTGEFPDASVDVPSDGTDEIALDSFDTSAMDGVDFGSSASSGDEFPATDDALGGDDDFVLDSNFEIPGFSDTETADMGKKKPLLDTVDFSKGKEGRPRNSLSDEEYAQFKKNLANYPLNLRIALEDFIARDEFTDDAVFEIIEKVLKKTPARQLATQLEKILDISINIPRDFEKRSFAEYEAYKQSFQYQLKNRIIPAAIVGVILAFVCFGLFKAGVHFIYKPVMANIHYKQGYTLLEANEFPQSEQEFQEAVRYRAVKKWFFKYAFGYRERKQYERAGQMYKRILAYFNHDKQAGLDYAEMELYDRANYERAEEIVRREVLDYHINDADGILLLGDVFLEWAEVAPEKYELAKEQYLDLIQRYGSNNVYLSRMLRYNIRTDKLREVLTYKNMFYVSKQDKQNLKNLGAADWTELSGYLLEKLYGTLSKNDEYLRSSIEDVLAMLNLAIKADPSNPVARYNLARYFIQNGNTEQAKVELERSLGLFDSVSVRTKKNIFREINAARVLGELYAENREYLKAQTIYTRGINLYNEEHESSGLEGDSNTGKLFADMGDLDYFISGEMDDALYNYERAIEIKNDTPSINYRVGAIYYNRKNYDNALASFIKVCEKEPRDPNILLSLGNVLSLRGDNFAAESYYSDLLRILDNSRDRQKFLLPQEDDDDFAIVDLYLKANNNLGVTLYRLANQTGNSSMNAEAIVRLSDSMRAWDSLTRNPETMIRLEGSNLAAQNSKYITHPYPDFEPAIYTDIPRILADEKGLE